jgi:cytochrome c oxidase assembly protein subunit 19
MADAFGGSRKNSKPPEKGVFPLDHGGECKIEIDAFLGCLKANARDHFPCKTFSKKYLQCRMDKNLMEVQNLNELGLEEGGAYVRVTVSEGSTKEAQGFVAGTSVQPGRLFKRGAGPQKNA